MVNHVLEESGGHKTTFLAAYYGIMISSEIVWDEDPTIIIVSQIITSCTKDNTSAFHQYEIVDETVTQTTSN